MSMKFERDERKFDFHDISFFHLFQKYEYFITHKEQIVKPDLNVWKDFFDNICYLLNWN